MKKSFLFAALAAVVLSGCYKSEVVEVNNNGPKEISFKAVSNVATKADAQLEGTELGLNYRIYASATQRRADGTIENPAYFTDQEFAPVYTPVGDETVVPANTPFRAWKNDAFAPIYWPIGGGIIDYIAYALPQDKHDNPAAVYENAATDVASKVSFTWNTYENQVDLLYDVKNGLTVETNAGAAFTGNPEIYQDGGNVGLILNHAQALLVFEAKVNIPGVFKINSITLGGHPQGLVQDSNLLVNGKFTVDNTRNNVVAAWSNLSAENGQDVITENDLGVDGEGNPIPDYLGEPLDAAAVADFVQVGSSLLIPQQPRLNFVINYTLGDNTMNYEWNDVRGSWEMGKKYVYKMDITLNEIIITEVVTDFVTEEVPVPLQ